VKPFSKVASILLALVSLLQLTRFLLGWEVHVNGATVPLWPSALACLVTGVLSVGLWREAGR
jgi:hypothetical protein